MEDVVIVSAARTPVGAFSGSFATVPAHKLGEVAIRGALERAKVAGEEVSEVILGQVLTAAQGQNPARQASIAAGIPIGAPAWSINMVCGSGLRTVALGAQAIRQGDSRIVVAGGQESMSLSAHAAYLRAGQKMGDFTFIDTMIRDGLWDAFNGYHMGITAENVANQWQITREDQDRFAVASQNKAEAARKAGRFKDEIVAVTVKGRKGDTVVDSDEYIRDGATYETVAGLRPAFTKDGSVTAGNASGINDGAAAIVLARASAAAGAKALGRVVGYAHAGVDPKIMGIGPIPAVQALCAKLGMKPQDFDVVESNEAFAAQALAVSRTLDLDPARVNPNGGAIALGHPVGATGAILVVKALYELARTGGKTALVTMCIGGGQGIALALERA